MDAILGGLRDSLRRGWDAAVTGGGRLDSVGVDSWGVDYGLLGPDGRLLEEPVCYRDGRTAGVMQAVFARVPRDEIYARTGIQFLPLNTLYQLFAHARDGFPAGARRLLLIPDLCHHFLCGSQVSEATNASTTQLLHAGTGAWDEELLGRLGLPRELMPVVAEPGADLGRLTPELRADLGVGALRVLAPATHDTASAVAGTPLEPGWAYVSSGTWSLVGVELHQPVLTGAACAASFTNERGLAGTVRFLKNVMGLWILESCRREWEAEAPGFDLDGLLAGVAGSDAFPGFVFPDDPRFFNPASMTAEVKAALAESGQAAPDGPMGLAKVVLDSLALRYASVLDTIEALTGHPVPGIHVVGGGSQNDYLNQATADAAGRPVRAGPAEATAAGNLVAQALACGELASLEDGRRRVARTVPPRSFTPRRARAWEQARRRYRGIEAHFEGRAAGSDAG